MLKPTFKSLLIAVMSCAAWQEWVVFINVVFRMDEMVSAWLKWFQHVQYGWDWKYPIFWVPHFCMPVLTCFKEWS